MDKRSLYSAIFRLYEQRAADPSAREGRYDVAQVFARYVEELRVNRSDNALRVSAHVGEKGTAWWRLYPWLIELAQDPEFDVRCSSEVVESDTVAWSDVVWLQRMLCPNIAGVAPLFDRPIVFEIDDYYHGVPPSNPLYDNRHQAIELTDTMLKLASVAVFSTQRLARCYASRCKRQAILPNAIDPDMWPDATRVAWTDGCQFGWAGSPTHNADLAVMRKPLANVLARNHDAWVIRMGAHNADSLMPEVPRDRIVENAWEPHPHTLHRYYRQVDVALAPLAINEFNRAKSNIKFLEAGACGAVTVATQIDPYAQDPGPNILINSNDPQEWEHELDRLANDSDLRARLGAAAREFVLERYTINRHIDGLKIALREAAQA